MRVSRILGAMLSIGLVLGLPPAHAKVPLADSRFVVDALAEGMAQIELGRLALSKATREDVRAFARMMVDDHSEANGELTSIASRKRVALPSAPRPARKATHDRLAKLSRTAFDAAYLTTTVKDHQKAVASFGKESAAGRDPDIRDWASRILPTLLAHLAKAKELAGRE